ncbi:MAG: hypothetical protein ACREC1_07115 [Methylovirgula sp.]
MTDQPNSGIEISTPLGGKISISGSAVDHILASFERVWRESLEWAQHNPILFLAFLIIVAAVIVAWRRSVVDIEQMKLEYDNARSQARTQLPLPLPNNDDLPRS